MLDTHAHVLQPNAFAFASRAPLASSHQNAAYSAVRIAITPSDPMLNPNVVP